jgi:hypothetical protein
MSQRYSAAFPRCRGGMKLRPQVVALRSIRASICHLWGLRSGFGHGTHDDDAPETQDGFFDNMSQVGFEPRSADAVTTCRLATRGAIP